MSWNIPKTWTAGEVLTKADLDTYLRDNINFLKTNIALEAGVELTIASGAVTKTQSCHIIDTEAAAASDDLDTINGGVEGDFIFVRSADGARSIIVKHNTGNIWNPSGDDITLDDADDCLILGHDGSKWCVLGGGSASDLAAHAALTATHGCTEIADVSDIAVDSNLSAAAQAAIAASHAPNSDTSLGTQSEDLDMGTHKITGVVDPVNDQEAATKKYVDDHSGGSAFSFDGGAITDGNNTCIVFDLGGVT